MSAPESTIILTDPKPLRQADDRCPRCRASAERRVLSAGFGQPHEICGQCGYEFPEETP